MTENITSAEIVSDLIRIHADRRDIYKQILKDSDKEDLDMKAIFERIVEESITYGKQLQEQIRPETSSPGKIYTMWLNEKPPVPEGSKKSILATCAADELVTNNTYSISIAMVTDEKIRTLLEEHQQGLKKQYSHLKQYYHAQ